MRNRSTLARALCLAVLLAASPAHADPATDGARADAMHKYEEGSKAFQEKRYKDAIDLFLAADQTVPNADLAYNTSLAYEAMGDAANALRWAREYLRRAPSADDRADVDKRVSKLERRLQDKGVQQVTIASSPAAATVYIDDRAVGVTPWTGELSPGSHRVEARLDGYTKASQLFELRPDRSLDVTIALERETPKAVPTPTPGPAVTLAPSGPTAPDAPPRGIGPLVPAGAAVFGAGLVGIGAAIGLELARSGAEQEAREAPIQLDAVAAFDAMESYQLGARVAAGIGAGLALAGSALLVVGIVTKPSSPTAPRVSFACAPTSCGATMRALF